ncbi:imelysin family protein [Echinicola shivajiensis]|uniref:imelysin family protein n=1 Tax=Echinicola shivajiensis TaxID=1035916 RepID=UPI001BFCB474|nr:imelysin family protein [Echinicola shivajiensis]
MKYKQSISKYLLIMVTGIICLLPSCVKDTEEKKEEVDRKPLLTSLADNVILPGYTEFHTATFALDQGVDVFIDSPDEANLSELRERFVNAYKIWQKVAFLDFGPAFTYTLRANLNTFPTDNFSIDNAISSGTIELDKISAQNKKGFPAMDYLLYGIGESSSDIIEQYTTGENAENRKAYLKAISADILNKTDQVYNGWLPAEGNYRDTFISKDGTDVGSSIGQMVNSLTQYFEVFTRDAKIGIPLGKRSQGVQIPRNAEAYYSENSIDLAADNLTGIIGFYQGEYGANSGEGLYDYLKSLKTQYNGQLLADAILSQLQTAKSKVSALPPPLTETVMSNPQPVEDAYDELQKSVVMLKVDMASALGVLISYQDNDGD